MSSVIDRVRKRRKCPVQIGDETVYVRGMTWAEWELIQPVKEEAWSNGIAIGWCLLEDDGKPVFTREPTEDLETFGKRVLADLDMEIGTGLYLSAKIMRATQEPPDEKTVENIVKN
jgi:hypothetical protein